MEADVKWTSKLRTSWAVLAKVHGRKGDGTPGPSGWTISRGLNSDLCHIPKDMGESEFVQGGLLGTGSSLDSFSHEKNWNCSVG